LDDHSVSQFIDLIKELSRSKTIIIVTHDPRLDSDNYTNIILKRNDVIINCNTINKNKINVGYQDKNKTNFIKLGVGLFKNYINFITLFVTLAVILMLSIYTQLQFKNGFSTDEIPPENVILSYKGEFYIDRVVDACRAVCGLFVRN